MAILPVMRARSILRRFLGNAVSVVLRRGMFESTGERPIGSLSVSDLKLACNWEELLAAGAVSEKDSPLSVAGLRFSRLFPDHFLIVRDARTEPLDLDSAAREVRRHALARLSNPSAV
jgi:hypothetical protein